jgi:hypothetical protein
MAGLAGLPTKVWWNVCNYLNVRDLLLCTRVSYAMRDAVMTFKPSKALNMSILPANKQHTFTSKALTDTPKEIITNHVGLDMSGTLITALDLNMLLRMNLAWISIERCAAITNRAATTGHIAVGTFIKAVQKKRNITTDLYMLDAGIPLSGAHFYS